MIDNKDHEALGWLEGKPLDMRVKKTTLNSHLWMTVFPGLESWIEYRGKGAEH